MPFRIQATFRPVATLAVLGCLGVAQAAPYRDDITLPAALYSAHIYAYGEGDAVTDVYQDDLYPYGGHHSQASPADWVLQNTVVRAQGAFDDDAKSSTSNDHDGTVRVDVHSNNYEASATASVLYYITLIGPDRDYVPLTISGYGRADASSQSGIATASASLSIDYRETGHNYYSNLSEAFGNHEGGTFSDVVNLQPNLGGLQANRIIMTATAGVGVNADPFDDSGYYGGTGAAFIDPVFTIADPTLAPLYKIVVGLAGVPTSPVPEPASGVMMMGGFGLLAWARRRGRRADGSRYTSPERAGLTAWVGRCSVPASTASTASTASSLRASTAAVDGYPRGPSAAVTCLDVRAAVPADILLTGNATDDEAGNEQKSLSPRTSRAGAMSSE